MASERDHLEARLRELEHNVDEQQAANAQLQEERKVEAEDWQKQVEALDKQVKSYKQFLEVSILAGRGILTHIAVLYIMHLDKDRPIYGYGTFTVIVKMVLNLVY